MFCTNESAYYCWKSGFYVCYTNLRIVPPEEWDVIFACPTLPVHYYLWTTSELLALKCSGFSCSKAELATAPGEKPVGMSTVGTQETRSGAWQHRLQLSSTFLLNLPQDLVLWELVGQWSILLECLKKKSVFSVSLSIDQFAKLNVMSSWTVLSVCISRLYFLFANLPLDVQS